MKASNQFKEIFGWYGAFAIMLAYFLVSFNIINADFVIYQMLNLTGAIGIVVVSLMKKNYQPGFLNAIWALIAFAALLQIILLN